MRVCMRGPYVLSTEVSDGEAVVTVSLADDDYKFDLWQEDGIALVDYQETLSYRGDIKVKDPDEDIYRALMTSDEVATLLDRWDASGVRRAAPTP